MISSVARGRGLLEKMNMEFIVAVLAILTIWLLLITVRLIKIKRLCQIFTDVIDSHEHSIYYLHLSIDGYHRTNNVSVLKQFRKLYEEYEEQNKANVKADLLKKAMKEANIK